MHLQCGGKDLASRAARASEIRVENEFESQDKAIIYQLQFQYAVTTVDSTRVQRRKCRSWHVTHTSHRKMTLTLDMTFVSLLVLASFLTPTSQQ
jgi:hypothetical protein